MGDYFLEPRAQRDVRDIREFISDSSPAAARRVMERLEQVFSNLADSPFLGRERPDLGTDLRGFPAIGYIIIYRPSVYGVEIMRVVRGSRDLNRLFR